MSQLKSSLEKECTHFSLSFCEQIKESAKDILGNVTPPVYNKI